MDVPASAGKVQLLARVLVPACLAAVLAFLILLNPPPVLPATMPPEAAASEAQPQPTIYPLPDPPFPEKALPTGKVEYRAVRALLLYLAPEQKYLTVGQIGRGARVEIIGRNAKGDWLAVSLTPGSKLYGWVPVAGVSGVQNVEALQVVPVKSLRQ